MVKLTGSPMKLSLNSGSQAMHFLNPFVQLLVSSNSFKRLAEVLEERSHLERLLRHVEVVTAAADAAREKPGQ